MYGNRDVAPDTEAAEFWTAATKLAQPRKELEGFRTRARTVAEACRKTRRERKGVDELVEITEGKGWT